MNDSIKFFLTITSLIYSWHPLRPQKVEQIQVPAPELEKVERQLKHLG